MKPIATSSYSDARRGFTLLELLTVIAVAGLLAALTAPAIQGLQRSAGFSKSVESMADTLRFAHFFAMANNTYVYCGITEVDVTQSAGARPQAYTNIGGRVAVTLVATRDGTSDASSWNSTGANLTQIRKVQVYDFFHVASTVFPTTTSGAMARPVNVVTTPLVLPASTAPATPLYYPLGTTSGGDQYDYSGTNSSVICFNPQGGVLVNGTPCQWLEVDLQPMAGTATPAAPADVNQGNQAALVMDGVTGAMTVYRP